MKFTLEQSMKALWGEYRYSSTLPLTLDLAGGGWSTPRPDRFTPGEDPVPIVQEAGWAPEETKSAVEQTRFEPGTS